MPELRADARVETDLYEAIDTIQHALKYLYAQDDFEGDNGVWFSDENHPQMKAIELLEGVNRMMNAELQIRQWRLYF